MPLYTLSEAARIVDTTPSTVHRWARGYTYRTPVGQVVTAVEPLITTTGTGRLPVVPFTGLAETYVLNAFRRSGVPMQRIRPALQELSVEMGIAAALASERLKTDGSELLYHYGVENPDSPMGQLVVIRNRQAVFVEVVEQYLQTITYEQGWVRSIALPQYRGVEVTVTPDINWGQPTVAQTGVRVADILSRVQAGEDVGSVARDFDLTKLAVQNLVKAA
ncbi:DUF433 domain-containing protein [Nakamurella sp. A5-74]|uniref:DUF433 domain-containing protein n=1 Tax=Nakamurella sp. A5-74 TaxID=3158264 RepID=A0AAU8DK41_9ACTN